MARGPDIIQNQSIPLSATSDQPVDDVARPPVNASNDAEDQTAGTPREITAEELGAAEAARKGAHAAPESDDAPPTKPAKPDAAPSEDDDGITVDKSLPHFAVNEITKVRRLTRERVATALAAQQAAEKLAADRAAEIEAARKELEEFRARPPEPEPVKVETDPRPTRDLFDDPDAYDDAITSWADREAGRKAAAILAETEATRKREADEAAAVQKAKDDEESAQSAHDAWLAKVSLATEKYPDYVEVTTKDREAGGPAISPVMAMGIQHADNGTDVAYYLAQDVEESVRIASIDNGVLQLIEIGRLAERLGNPPRRAGRPRPIEPVLTDRTPSDAPDPDGEDMEAYAARRTKEMAPNRQPFFPNGGLH